MLNNLILRWKILLRQKILLWTGKWNIWLDPPSRPPLIPAQIKRDAHVKKIKCIIVCISLMVCISSVFQTAPLWFSFWQMEKDVFLKRKMKEEVGQIFSTHYLQQKQSWLYFSNCTLILFLTLTGVRGEKRLASLSSPVSSHYHWMDPLMTST